MEVRVMHMLLPETMQGASAVLGDILAYLTGVWQDGVDTQEASNRFHQLQAQYPQLRLELLWEAASYECALQYTVLLYLAEGGTVSLSLNPDEAIPWLLRWAHHTRESEVVRVNKETLTIEQMMGC